MGTTTAWRRKTSFEHAREEQKEDGYNGIAFSSKRVAKTREKEEVKKVADNLLLYTHLYGSMLIMKME